jgi:hypothetical protein
MPKIGKANVAGLNGGTELVNMFVSHIEKGQGKDAVQRFLQSKEVTVAEIECVSNANARLESYKVRVDKKHFDALYGEGAEDFWPTGIRCRPWIKPRTTGGTLTNRS